MQTCVEQKSVEVGGGELGTVTVWSCVGAEAKSLLTVKLPSTPSVRTMDLE
jgi:hypothetical protein